MYIKNKLSVHDVVRTKEIHARLAFAHNTAKFTFSLNIRLPNIVQQHHRNADLHNQNWQI